MAREKKFEKTVTDQVKLGNQNWASIDCYVALGRKVKVRSVSDEFGALVRGLLRSFPVCDMRAKAPDVVFSIVDASTDGSAGCGRLYYFFRNGNLVRKTKKYWMLFRLLEWQLNVFLAEEVSDHVLLHAGAVAKDGIGIILPGSSRSGKSSLTMALLLQGYDYLTDEIAAIATATGEALAFPKPLSCRNISLFPDLVVRQNIWFGPKKGALMVNEQESGGSSPVWFAHPEDIRLGSIGGSVPIKYIIFPQHTPGDTAQLLPISKSKAMKGLIVHAVNFLKLGKDGLHHLGRMVDEADCYSLIGNGLQASSTLITELVKGQRAGPC